MKSISMQSPFLIMLTVCADGQLFLLLRGQLSLPIHYAQQKAMFITFFCLIPKILLYLGCTARPVTDSRWISVKACRSDQLSYWVHRFSLCEHSVVLQQMYRKHIFYLKKERLSWSLELKSTYFTIISLRFLISSTLFKDKTDNLSPISDMFNFHFLFSISLSRYISLIY